ncbi:MAG TPA: ABC-2 family transporter protein [Gemmatimonadaceae bacterium]|nr:ABC-2 family transporter protein [Gemmatimonadaceae bacterium]
MPGMKATARFATALVATSVRAAMAERGAFLMRVVLMAVNNAIFFTFWIVLLSRVPRIRGYALGDVAVLYGIVAVAHGLAVFVAGGIQYLARVIHDGELDALIAQPKPTLLYAVGLRSQPSGLGDIVSGLVMIALSGRASLLGIPLVIAAGIAGAAVLVSTSVLMHSAAFWLGRTESASRQMYEVTIMFSLYPDTLFTGPMRWLLFTVIPAGFVGYLPAELIRAPAAWTAVAIGAGVTAYAYAAKLVFERGLRVYSSGSRFATFG